MIRVSMPATTLFLILAGTLIVGFVAGVVCRVVVAWYRGNR